MEGERLAGYRLVRKLGSGAMGTVWLAESDDGPVALKVLHPQQVGRRGFFRRFQTEAQTGMRVNHPNVVRTIDCDFLMLGDSPCCLLVFEYVEGKTLREMLLDRLVLPEALVREVALQAAAGLAAIHAAGIVHQDLKPENLLVTADFRLRIMDLGVARFEDRSESGPAEGRFAGSLHYAAPEQVRGERATAAADLYALGVTLYELATGENPFRHDDPARVIHAHASCTSPPARERNPDLSHFFSELVSTLLAKSPAERFGSAAELAEVLAAGEKSPWWSDRDRHLGAMPSAVPRLPVRRETELRGREGELSLLEDAWLEAERGQGSAILLSGEAGIGKTRLIDAFLARLSGSKVRVLYGSYPPFGGIGALSESLVAAFGHAGLEENIGSLLAATPSLVPTFARLVAEETLPPDAGPLRVGVLHSLFCRVMHSLAAETPLVWVVEDLHFAEPESLGILAALVRAIEGHRALLILTTRGTTPGAGGGLPRGLPGLRSVPLDRLPFPQVTRMLRDALRNEDLAEKLAARVAYRSDGVPFFVLEILRALRAEAFLTDGPDGRSIEARPIGEIRVPSAIRDIVELRLRDLDEDERRVLEVGAAQGFVFDPDLTARVLGRCRLAVLEALARLDSRGGSVRAEGAHYRFDHHQVHEVVYAGTPEERRREYHARLACAVVEREGVTPGGPVPGETAYLLAYHHLRGNCPTLSLPFLTPALVHLERALRSEAVLDLAGRALAQPGLLTGPDRIDVLLCRLARLHHLGRREEEAAVLPEALRLGETSDDPIRHARVLLQQGEHLLGTGRFPEAAVVLARAVEIARVRGDQRLESSGVNALGRLQAQTGQFDQALRHHERYLLLTRAQGHRPGEASALLNIGSVLISLSRTEEAQRAFREAAEIAVECGDPGVEGMARANLGVSWQRFGRYEEARRELESALALACRAGDREREGIATLNLGATCLGLGRREEAQAHFERAAVLGREIGHRQLQGMALGNLGIIQEQRGRTAEARRCFELYLGIFREIGYPEGVGTALVNLGPLRTVLGDFEGARGCLDEALTLLRGIGARRPEGYALAGLGELEDNEGRADLAIRRYEEAIAVWKEIRYPSGASIAGIRLGSLLARAGRIEEARAWFEESLELARGVPLEGTMAMATVRLALLPGGGPARARDVLGSGEASLTPTARMDIRLELYRAEGRAEDIEEAHRLLLELLAHAPPECREPMLARVRLFRELQAEWKRARTAAVHPAPADAGGG